jgi:hypothetical protein
MRAKLLYVSGSIALAFAIFHCFFWVMFDWAGELPKLSQVNAGIMQMFNLVSILGFLFQGFASFYLAKKDGPFNLLEKSVLVFIGGFYFLRAALGFPLFGVDMAEVAVVMVCMTVVLANVLALKIPGPVRWR